MATIQLKPKQRISPEEQETTVIIDCDAKASVYSSAPKMVKEFQQWLENYPELVEVHADDDFGTLVSIPKKWIKIKPPKRMSDEWRERAEKRLQESRAKLSKGKELR